MLFERTLNIVVRLWSSMQLIENGPRVANTTSHRNSRIVLHNNDDDYSVFVRNLDPDCNEHSVLNFETVRNVRYERCQANTSETKWLSLPTSDTATTTPPSFHTQNHLTRDHHLQHHMQRHISSISSSTKSSKGAARRRVE